MSVLASSPTSADIETKMFQVKDFYHAPTGTLSYVVYDDQSNDAVVIDPVLDYDQPSSRLSETAVHEIAEFIRGNGLRPHFILETHVHADHVSAAQILKREFTNLRIGVGARVCNVQAEFKKIFNLGSWFVADGSQFDVLFSDGQVVDAGTLQLKIVFTPGHTASCVMYQFGESAAFVGDAIFMPDSGTGRCDFPLASAEILYQTIHDKLYQLPEQMLLYTGHDYLPADRPLKFSATVLEQKKNNIHLNAQTTREEFVKFRTSRDRTLSAPKLILPSVQININAGALAPVEENGKHYLKIPIS